ncbi:MAG: 30S ribosomal protein S17e [Theionarchaea archaeon]|nr:30S ribosomal protein S17e [Theionarchaea archaeon]MBU6999855.1 30S ribosomal protein S17e [Theionarchaea archaeon]MBU7020045.1 30S ribosomal protein S17e [Theionarchaea archaeon]MBU7036255.1 30S ribosomal protein S17e [Theionarchaea archaeon]MBU7039539.1 30S ribosomal protein S17e [Theionarchaea archaeon]
MGRIRSNFIKRIARETIKKYKDQLSTDYYENRDFLETVVRFSNDKLRNRVAGYVTTLMKHGE